LEYLLCDEVDQEELPTHAEEEELRVPMSNQDLVDRRSKLLVLYLNHLGRICTTFLMTLRDYLINDIGFLCGVKGAFVEFVVCIVGAKGYLGVDVLVNVIVDVAHQQLPCGVVVSDLEATIVEAEGLLELSLPDRLIHLLEAIIVLLDHLSFILFVDKGVHVFRGVVRDANDALVQLCFISTVWSSQGA
jgi:hypothetical protein